MKVIKVIMNETFKSSKGKEIRKSFYAIEIDNGNIVPVKPLHNDGYAKLDLISEKRFPKSSNDDK